MCTQGGELAQGLDLLGEIDGSVGEAVGGHVPVAVPGVGADVAAGPDLACQKAVQSSGAGVGQHLEGSKSGHRRASRVALGAMLRKKRTEVCTSRKLYRALGKSTYF